MEGPLVDGSVTEKAYHYLPGEGSTDGHPHASAHDAVGTQVSVVEIGNVHRSAFSLTGACCLAHDLGHHPVEIDLQGNALSVSAMIGGDHVKTFLDGSNSPHVGGLFSNREMCHPGNHPFFYQFVYLAVEIPDIKHQPMHMQHLLLC